MVIVAKEGLIEASSCQESCMSSMSSSSCSSCSGSAGLMLPNPTSKAICCKSVNQPQSTHIYMRKKNKEKFVFKSLTYIC